MIKRLRVTVDGTSYDVTVEVQDESNPVAAAPAPVILPPPAPVTRASAPVASTPAATTTTNGAGDVPSPLSGRVTAVIVQLGQQVKEGDHLLTLEAMKMNTFVFAPCSGKVTAIKTEVGGVVNEGQVLVTIG
jgi:biotin carboxyl carrier protein